MKRKIGALQIVPLVCMAIGIVFLVMSLKFGFWVNEEGKNHGPTPGFYPAIMSVAMIVTSIVVFIQSLSQDSPKVFGVNWLVPLGLVAIVAAGFVIGTIPAILVFLIVWLRFYEKCSWKTTIIATAIMMAIVIGAFRTWLGIRFPKGLIYNLIWG